MRQLRTYIRMLLEGSGHKILIPSPPHISQLVAELDQVSEQYENKKNPPELQQSLDADFPDLFNLVVKEAGYPCVAHFIYEVDQALIPIIIHHKQHFDTLRPTQLAAKVGHPFVGDYLLKSAQTASYPSGHTTQAFYLAMFLSKMYPDLEADLFTLAQMVADSRIDRGVHFPSDNAAGKQLAEVLFEMSKS